MSAASLVLLTLLGAAAGRRAWRLTKEVLKKPPEPKGRLKTHVLRAVLLMFILLCGATIVLYIEYAYTDKPPTSNAPILPVCPQINVGQFPSCARQLFVVTRGTCDVPQFVYGNTAATPQESLSAYCASLELEAERMNH